MRYLHKGKNWCLRSADLPLDAISDCLAAELRWSRFKGVRPAGLQARRGAAAALGAHTLTNQPQLPHAPHSAGECWSAPEAAGAARRAAPGFCRHVHN